MEKPVNYFPNRLDIKRHLPRGYIKKVAGRIKKVNEDLSLKEQIASSDFMISKVVNELKHNHPIFPFVIEVIMEKKEADKEKEKWLRDTFTKIITP